MKGNDANIDYGRNKNDEDTNDKELRDDSHLAGLYMSGKLLLIVLLVACSVATISWGVLGSAGSYNTASSSSPEYDSMHSGTDKLSTLEASTKNTKPNFVFFLIDDLPWNAMGYQGFDLYFATPNMDKFAKDGIILSNYYAQETCTPSRSALMTGRYPVSTGMQYGELQVFTEKSLPTEEVLLPEVLRELGGYKNYILGKWNLGNSAPEMLPTSRGFDEFVGYLGGGMYPFSKMSNIVSGDETFLDLMHSTTTCYNKYAGDDIMKYSTYVFENNAIDMINKHDFGSAPMFLYMAFHSTHAPLREVKPGMEPSDPDGMLYLNADQVGDHTYNQILEGVAGFLRQDLAAAVNLVDQTVANVVQAMHDNNQGDNTYFIVASDNGGCSDAGGTNAPLRGNKGTLWEGGTKVTAFMFGDIIPRTARGSEYKGLMHVTDWFPTILDLAGVTYHPADSSRQLDGVNQATAVLASEHHSATAVPFKSMSGVVQSMAALTDMNHASEKTTAYPRTNMLYNAYVNIAHFNYSVETGTSAAVRDERFKLFYTFAEADSNSWFYYDNPAPGLSVHCSNIVSGIEYTRYLFDLKTDPYERHNLYGKPEYAAVQEKLTALLEEHAGKAVECPLSHASDSAVSFFQHNDNYVQPWYKTLSDYNPDYNRSSFAVKSGLPVPTKCSHN